MKTFTTIEEVILHLDEIIKWAKQNKSPIGYFASTYRSMTIAVLDGIKKKKFEDNNRMILLDLAFANRYFEAWEDYKTTRNAATLGSSHLRLQKIKICLLCNIFCWE